MARLLARSGVSGRQPRRYDYDELRVPERVKPHRPGLVAVVLVVAGALVACSTNLGSGRAHLEPAGNRSPAGRTGPGTYPMLVPWTLGGPRPPGAATSITVHAWAHACFPDGDRSQAVAETLDRVEVHETSETVTVETWIGPPPEPGFQQACLGDRYALVASVRLGSPLGSRALVDPACGLQEYARSWPCDR